MIKRCYINTLLVISGLILLTGIIFFLWNTDIFKFKDAIDSEKFGQFGDYIGGILGTVFAGSGFILLILTYRLQSDENRINRQNSDLSYLNNLYSEIISDINSITFTAEENSQNPSQNNEVEKTYKTFNGIDAFYNFKKENYASPNSVMDHLNSILYSYENLLIIAKKSRYENDEFRAITLTRIYFLFYSKILWPVHKHIWTKLRPTLISGHDDSKHIFPRFKKLAKEVIEELQKKDLIEREKKHINDILE